MMVYKVDVRHVIKKIQKNDIIINIAKSRINQRKSRLTFQNHIGGCLKIDIRLSR
jgi:hypothetical protein